MTRDYCDAGAGGIAVGVHTTQFAIRDRSIGLFGPVLELASRTARDWCRDWRSSPLLIAGACGDTVQAVDEAAQAVALGYNAALLSMAALRDASNADMLEHCRRVADVIPVIGFYLQPAVGGRVLDRDFWRGFLDIERVVAIKVAPFDRYRTLDVVSAVIESGRRDVALYTGNDDAIVADLLTPFTAAADGTRVHFAGGLLGQWAVWTSRAVELLDCCRAVRREDASADGRSTSGCWQCGRASLTPMAAIFDAAHEFAGCIPGIHEVLRRQGLLAGRMVPRPARGAQPGQMSAIDRALSAYPQLSDDRFVRERLDGWLGEPARSLQSAMASRQCYHCKQQVEEGEAHDCWTTTEAALTRDLSEDLQEAWERLRETAVDFGDQRIYASHNSIMFSRTSCYFFVRPKTKFLEVCVFLGRAVQWSDGAPHPAGIEDEDRAHPSNPPPRRGRTASHGLVAGSVRLVSGPEPKPPRCVESNGRSGKAITEVGIAKGHEIREPPARKRSTQGQRKGGPPHRRGAARRSVEAGEDLLVRPFDLLLEEPLVAEWVLDHPRR